MDPPTDTDPQMESTPSENNNENRTDPVSNETNGPTAGVNDGNNNSNDIRNEDENEDDDEESVEENDADETNGEEKTKAYEGGNFDATLLSGEDRDRLHDEKFEQLEKEFLKTLQELSGDDNLSKFKLEYEKLHKILIKSRENEKRLVGKCKDLNAEMIANAAKVQASLKASQSDRTNITNLKKEIKKAWKMVEASNEREAKSKEIIQQLKNEVAGLQRSLEQGPNVGLDQENSVNELIRQKEELTKERDTVLNQTVQLRNELSDMMEKIRVLEAEKLETEHEIHTLKDLIATKKSEADREQRNKERLERELKDARQVIEQKNAEVRAKQDNLNRAKEEISKLETNLKEQKLMIEKSGKDQENLQTRTQKLQQDYEEQIMTTTQLLAENQQKAAEIKMKEDDIAKIKEEMKNISRLKDGLAKKIKSVEDTKYEAELERDKLRAINHSYEREIEQLKKQAEADKKQIEDLVRERDIVNKNLQKATSGTQKQINLVKLHEQTKRNLEQEIMAYKEEAAKQRKIIYQLEKERDHYITETSQIQTQLVNGLEEVKMKEMQIYEYKKKIAEIETKLKQQQNLYEAVRSDRNLYSKNLIESQDEIAEMRRKLKIMNHQIDQLKEEIQNKEGALVKEHFEHLKVEKEKDGLKNELQKLKQQSDMAQQYIQSQQAEEHKLRHIIAEADAERLRQKKEYDAIIQERDILGTQLIRRNDELALLYEKIKIQQSTLNKGEIQYRERVEDIRVLKLEIKKLRREKAILQNETSNVDSLKHEIYRVQRELLREKTRVKVLEEELENPMNIHRWRKLEGSDPTTFDLIQKIQTLQKRLIAKTEEVVEKELLIQQKEKLYIELKNILARQPGPEVAEQINIYQQTLKDKTNQLKAMASELNMYQAQVNEYKYEIERLNRDMQEIKKKYYEQKKKEAASGAILRQALPLPQQIKPNPQANLPKFSGGGFNMTKA